MFKVQGSKFGIDLPITDYRLLITYYSSSLISHISYLYAYSRTCFRPVSHTDYYPVWCW